ncbi:MAG: metal/formaldehyde-sensitive transcriptional repressor [Siculibacillus sp.]|nr:metal/formaldehyde-sensitive transcriptional repressor [Siculibacillus sp.]
MPHSPEDKKRALARLARIAGQVAALRRAIEAGTDCSPLLQQIAALRGAVGGLMAEVIESHLKETLARSGASAEPPPDAASDAELDGVLRILRTYLT